MYVSRITLVSVLFCFGIFSCTPPETPLDKDEAANPERMAVLELQKEYEEGWLAMDEAKILAVFEEDASIQPGTLNPVQGKENLRAFWFPNDSSVTEILAFRTNLLTLKMVENHLVTTHETYLDWNYTKDSLHFGNIQKGVSTTIFRKQEDESWKMWKKIWTDTEITKK